MSLLDAYFARIGFQGAARADLATLTALHRLHPAAIPFENLNPFLHLPVEISPEAVAEKLLRQSRGGYCFEQNSLLFDVLSAIGFTVTPLAARVIWNAGPDARTGLTHRITKVSLPEGDFLADVGFGGQSPTAPLRLVADTPQLTPHGAYRLVKAGPAFELQFETTGGWRGMYRFTDEAQGAIDYEMGNWFSSTHPRSHFRHMLIAARVVDDARVNLRNKEVTTWRNGAETARRIAAPEDLERLLVETYGIKLPARIAEIWEKIPDA